MKNDNDQEKSLDKNTNPGQSSDDKNSQIQNPGNAIKDPDEWTTGDEPLTGAQQSYLHTLATEAGVTIPEGLRKAEASKKIEELQQKTGRGK